MAEALTDQEFDAILNEYSMNSAKGTGGRRQQAADRRDQLLATALDVIAAKGLDGATVKDCRTQRASRRPDCITTSVQRGAAPGGP